MNKIEKWKEKFPIDSIIKHKSCNLMYEIIDFKYLENHKNYYGILDENFVIIKTLFFPKDKIGKIDTYYIHFLKEFELSNLDYLNMLFELRNKKEQEERKKEKYEQLKLF